MATVLNRNIGTLNWRGWLGSSTALGASAVDIFYAPDGVTTFTVPAGTEVFYYLAGSGNRVSGTTAFPRPSGSTVSSSI